MAVGCKKESLQDLQELTVQRRAGRYLRQANITTMKKGMRLRAPRRRATCLIIPVFREKATVRDLITRCRDHRASLGACGGDRTTSNADDIFVGNFDGTVVRFSKADIAVHGNASVSTVIGTALGFVEGITLDFDGSVGVTTRTSNTVYRLDSTGIALAGLQLAPMASDPERARRN